MYKRISHNGYIEVYLPGHHRARGNKYVFEHILVAEKMIRRHLNKDEVVHHKNEVKTDNRPENLQVMTNSEHTALHSRKRPKKGVFKNCETCGKEFYRKPSRAIKARFCSARCLGLSSAIGDFNNKNLSYECIKKAVDSNDGNKKKAAEYLGIHYATIYKYLKRGEKKHA